MEMLGQQALLGFRDPQVLQEIQDRLVVKVNQDLLVKSSLQPVLILWPSLDLQDQPGLQVLLDFQVCLVPLVLLVSQDNQVLKENKGRKVRRERTENLENLVTASRQKPSVPPAPTNSLQWPDLLAHQDLQGLLENLVFRVPLVKLNRVLQDAEVHLESQVLVNLDLQERKENLAALYRHQKPFLLDHQDLQDPRAHKAHQVIKDHKDTKVNQDNQVFQEVQGRKVLVSQVSLDSEGFQDQKDKADLKVHQGQWGHKDLKVKQEFLEPPLVVLTVPDPQARLVHLVHLDQLMWASTSQSTFKVVESDSTWLDLLDLQVLQGSLVLLELRTDWWTMWPTEWLPTFKVQVEDMMGLLGLPVLRVHLVPSLSMILSASYNEKT